MAYDKKAKTENEVFILTVPLEPTRKQKALMDRYFNAALMIEHHLMSEELGKLKQMERTKQWKELQKKLTECYTKISKASEKEAKALDAERKDLCEQRNEILKKYGFSDFSFQADVVKHRGVYNSLVHSDAAQKIATNVWKSFSSYLFGDGKEIRYTSWKDFTSIACKKNSTGIRYCEKDKTLVVSKEHIKIGFHHTDKYGYETEAMKRNIHFCGIVRQWYPSGWKYFAQIYLGGRPPLKVDPATGEVLHSIGKGDVGNDIGPQTLATVSEKKAQLAVLAENVQTRHDELRRLQRKMDRSRRASNPKMFDEKGRVIPIDKLPPECVMKIRGEKRRKWNKTKNYLRLESKVRFLHMLITLQKLQAHHQLANELVVLGDKHYIEKMNWRALAKRRKEDKVTEKGKHLSKRRFGRSIANKSPSTFVKIYKRKVISQGGTFVEIDTAAAKASQYNHMDHTYKKKKLSQRWNHMPNGDVVQRDLYSAFLIQCSNRQYNGFSKYKTQKRYPAFKALHDQVIKDLTHKHTPSSTGVKFAA